MMQRKVSMVVPCYNKAAYIDEMFQSVFDQQWDNIQIILVNDGSTDGTREKIEIWKPQFITRGFEVIIVDQENRGVGLAVRNGLDFVTGDYVCMPDCDDVLSVRYVQAMAEALDNDMGVQWVVSGCKADQTITHSQTSDFLDLYLCDVYYWSVCTKMVRTQYLSECNISMRYAGSRFTQEPQINIPLVLGGSAPYILQENLYVYKQRVHSIMESVRHDIAQQIAFWNDYKKLVVDVLKAHNAFSEHYEQLFCLAVYRNVAADYDGCFQNCKTYFFNKYKFSKECISMLNTLDLPSAAFVLCCRALCIRPKKPVKTIDTLTKAEKIVACGCLGQKARCVLPLMKYIGMNVTAFWDAGARDNSTVYGLRVEKPLYDSTTESDVCLILVDNILHLEDIKSNINKAKILDINHVNEFLIWEINNRYFQEAAHGNE